MAKGRTRQRIRLDHDEGGSLMVLEAILVALLVLTAILFFTSVQRPSSGTDQGGIDLGQVAADTLAILEVRSIEGQTFEGWITNATRGDAATVTAVESFLGEVLPTGTRFALRLGNGVSNLTILATGESQPHGARAAQVMLLPNWANQRRLGPITTVLTPGQVLQTTDAGYDTVNPAGSWLCYRSPTGHTTMVDADATADTWASHWKATPGGVVTWKTALPSSAQQVPKDLLYGTWHLFANADCSGATKLVSVLPQGVRTLSVTTTFDQTTFTVDASNSLSASDVGKFVVGANVPGNGTRIVAVGTPTFAAKATATGATTITLGPDPTFLPYSIELVVWFGA